MSKTWSTLIVGVVIGMLIAPHKGSKTRRKISRRIQSLRDTFECSVEPDSSIAPLARDSGLSRRMSPDMGDAI